MKTKAFIKVNGIVYTVYTVPVMSLQLLEGKNIGTCSYVDKAIYLSQDLEGDVLLRSLVHELTHAYIYEYSQIQYSEEHRWSPEDLCIFMEHYGMQIVKDAQDIFDGMFKKTETKVSQTD